MTLDIRLDAVLRSIQLLEHQLRAPVNVRDMAAEAGYSPYYFCALFSQWAGHSPYDYMIRRRMTEAGKELIDTDRRIIDVAMDYQFETHEGFTRAYKRMFGHPPRDSKQAGCLPYLSCLEPLGRAHLECLWLAGRFVPKEIKAWEEIPGVQYDIQTCYPGNSVLLQADQPTMMAVFELPSSADPLIALNWILHTWLFFSPYQFHGMKVNWVKEGTLVVPLVMK